MKALLAALLALCVLTPVKPGYAQADGGEAVVDQVEDTDAELVELAPRGRIRVDVRDAEAEELLPARVQVLPVAGSGACIDAYWLNSKVVPSLPTNSSCRNHKAIHRQPTVRP